MRKVFADAQYFIALLNDKDQAHRVALAISGALQAVTLVTTDEALTEVLAYFAERGPYLRQVAVAYVEDILADPEILVREQSRHTFLNAIAFYKTRQDKGHSSPNTTGVQTT